MEVEERGNGRGRKSKWGGPKTFPCCSRLETSCFRISIMYVRVYGCMGVCTWVCNV